MGLGPIPWWVIKDYAIFKGLDSELFEPFIQIIMTMDKSYLETQSKNKPNG